MMNRNFEIYKYAVGGMLPTQEDLVFKGANIDFADYIAPNITGIGNDAAFAQKTANDRLDALLKQRQTIIDEIKLDKRYATQQGQLRGQLESLIDQAAQSQLSDNANFTKFNTGLMKIKNDVVLQKALKSTENAKVYADWRTKNSNALGKAYLNGGNEDNFQRWQRGETDEFVMAPTYVEPNWQEDLFKIAKDIPEGEKEIFKQLGSAVYQEKTKGKKAEDIKARMNNHVNYLLTSDPKTAPHFKRMMQFGYDPLPEIQKVINSAADLYKNESVTLSAMSANPNKLTPYQERSLAVQERNAATSERNSLNRMADEGSTGNIRIKKKPGLGSGDQVDILFGTEKFNDDYKNDIANVLSTEDEAVDPTQITLIDVEPSGRITYKVKLEDGTEKVGVKVHNPLKTAIQSGQVNFLGGTPPAKSPVKSAPKGNVDKNNPLLK